MASPKMHHSDTIKGKILTSEYPSSTQLSTSDSVIPMKSPRLHREHSDSAPTKGELQLREIIKQMGEVAHETKSEHEEQEKEDQHRNACIRTIHRSQHFIGEFLEKPVFHYFIISLIIVDLLLLFVDMIFAQLTAACLNANELKQYNTTKQPKNCLVVQTPALETGHNFVYYLALVLLCFFVLEIFASFYAFGWRHFTKLLFFVDAFMVLSSFVLEVYSHFGGLEDSQSFAVVFFLRLWMILRAFHAVAHSISLRNGIIIENIEKALDIVKEEKEKAHEKLEKKDITIDFLLDIVEKNGIQIDETEMRKFIDENMTKEEPTEFS